MKVKKHLAEGKLLLAVCDSSLIGKKFSEGDLQLDLTGKFYEGEEKTEEEILELMKTAYCVNLVGEKSVAVGKKAGLITEDHIIKIEGIPHAQGVVVVED